jgi:hypothetical protein
LLTQGNKNIGPSAPFFMFFAFIGLGYMFIEISQVERLVIFLGHPTYSLIVSLPVLLVGTGYGAYLTKDVGVSQLLRETVIRLAALICALVIFSIISQQVTVALEEKSTLVRMVTVASLLFPLGVFMGMALPLGLKLAAQRCGEIISWLWGINGACSVCASVLAMAVAINSGIKATFWTGCVCYVMALIALIWISRAKDQKSYAQFRQAEGEPASEG